MEKWATPLLVKISLGEVDCKKLTFSETGIIGIERVKLSRLFGKKVFSKGVTFWVELDSVELNLLKTIDFEEHQKIIRTAYL